MPVIGYNLNIPAANNNPSQDQPKMQTNTNAINTLISLDHFTFADSQAGRHKQVTLTNEAAPGLNGGNGVLYGNLQAGQSWPFWQNALGSFQLATLPVISATQGSAVIPGGLILKWGKITSPGSSGTLIYTTPFPSGNPPLTIQLTLERSSGNQTVTVDDSPAPTPAAFDYLASSGGSAFLYWFAIGN